MFTNKICKSLSKQRKYYTTASTLPHTPITPNLIPNEPTQPSLRTTIPGPKSQAILNDMNKLQDIKSIHFIADYNKSLGNYIVDSDNNTLLDVFNQISSIPIGYNNPYIIDELSSNKQFIQSFVNRPALGIAPDVHWPNMLQQSLMSIAPQGLTQVCTLMCGSCANEVSWKAAFMYYRYKQRVASGNTDFTPEEMTSCMDNKLPGSTNNLSILSFNGSFHGRLFGSLSCSRSKDIHKVDIPAFEWPKADFPRLKYPLEEHIEYNNNEEQRCIEQVEHILQHNDKPVVAIVVEPVLAEGGDLHASNTFFQQLRTLCTTYDILFCVDEVQTGGGACGSMWKHEQWQLTTPPDIVTFSKKLQSSGYYHNIDIRPKQPYRNFNTWMGEPSKLLLTQAIVKQINQHNLIENTQITGQYIYNELQHLSKSHTGYISNLRTAGGTMIAYDLPTATQRDKLLSIMRNNGIQTAGCGINTVRLRPQLIFEPKHAVIYLDKLDKSLKQLQQQ